MKPVGIGVQRYQRLEHGIFLTEFESRIGFKKVLIEKLYKGIGVSSNGRTRFIQILVQEFHSNYKM